MLKFILFWRPCNFTPLHSLTGPVGQPLASSRLGSQWFTSRGCTNSPDFSCQRYIGDTSVIDHRPQPKLRTDNGKLHQASCRRCEKPAVITHCLLRFNSTPCRFSSSSQHSDRLEPRSSCWGGGALWRPCNFTPRHSENMSSGSTVCFPSGGSAVHVLGMHKLTLKPDFSCQQRSPYIILHLQRPNTIYVT